MITGPLGSACLVHVHRIERGVRAVPKLPNEIFGRRARTGMMGLPLSGNQLLVRWAVTGRRQIPEP